MKTSHPSPTQVSIPTVRAKYLFEFALNMLADLTNQLSIERENPLRVYFKALDWHVHATADERNSDVPELLLSVHALASALGKAGFKSPSAYLENAERLRRAE